MECAIFFKEDNSFRRPREGATVWQVLILLYLQVVEPFEKKCSRLFSPRLDFYLGVFISTYLPSRYYGTVLPTN